MKFQKNLIGISLSLCLLIGINSNLYSQIVGPASAIAGQPTTYALLDVTSSGCPSVILTSNVSFTVSPSGATVVPTFNVVPNPSFPGLFLPSASITFPNTCGTFTITAFYEVFQPGQPACFTETFTKKVTVTNCLTAPVFTARATQTHGCNVAPLFFRVSAPGATSFSWTFPTGWTVSGPSNIDQITLIPDGLHGGTVTCTASNGAISASTSTIVTLLDPVATNLNINTCSTCEAVTVNGSVLIDVDGQNNGSIANSLKFGDCSTGEAVASKRTSGGNQYGLDFYTDFKNRMAITNGGQVGIGTITPNAQLSVIGPNTGSVGVANSIYTSISTTGVNDVDRAIHSEAGATGTNAVNCGVYSRATGTGAKSSNYGVCGIAYNGGINYGVYGSVIGSYPSNCAGYFDGDLVYSGTLYNGSDERLKTNIQDLKNSLDLLKKIKPKTYDFKIEDYKNSMTLPEGNQIGIIAQNMQSVFPNLVKEKVSPSHVNPKTNERLGEDTKFLAVNYVGLIPVLVQAVNELDAKTDSIVILKAAIDNTNITLIAMQKQIDDICNGGCASLKGSSSDQSAIPSNLLLQNVPNPFSQTTSIGYVFNTGTIAYINVNSLDGKLIKRIDLTTKGQGSIGINANTLSAGTYTYTMYVDNNVIDTKLMVITSQE